MEETTRSTIADMKAQRNQHIATEMRQKSQFSAREQQSIRIATSLEPLEFRGKVEPAKILTMKEEMIRKGKQGLKIGIAVKE